MSERNVLPPPEEPQPDGLLHGLDCVPETYQFAVDLGGSDGKSTATAVYNRIEEWSDWESAEPTHFWTLVELNRNKTGPGPAMEFDGTAKIKQSVMTAMALGIACSATESRDKVSKKDAIDILLFQAGQDMKILGELIGRKGYKDKIIWLLSGGSISSKGTDLEKLVARAVLLPGGADYYTKFRRGSEKIGKGDSIEDTIGVQLNMGLANRLLEGKNGEYIIKGVISQIGWYRPQIDGIKELINNPAYCRYLQPGNLGLKWLRDLSMEDAEFLVGAGFLDDVLGNQRSFNRKFPKERIDEWNDAHREMVKIASYGLRKKPRESA